MAVALTPGRDNSMNAFISEKCALPLPAVGAGALLVAEVMAVGAAGASGLPPDSVEGGAAQWP